MKSLEYIKDMLKNTKMEDVTKLLDLIDYIRYIARDNQEDYSYMVDLFLEDLQEEISKLES